MTPRDRGSRMVLPKTTKQQLRQIFARVLGGLADDDEFECAIEMETYVHQMFADPAVVRAHTVHIAIGLPEEAR